MGGDTLPSDAALTQMTGSPADAPGWERFFQENRGLFTGLARKINPNCQHADRDDAHQVAYLAGLAAGLKFDAARGVRFETYAYASASNAVRRHFQRASTAIRTTSDWVEKEAPSEKHSITVEEQRRAVRQFVDGLEGIDRELIELRYYQNLSMQQTADALKVSKTTVFKREARILMSGRRPLAAWAEG